MRQLAAFVVFLALLAPAAAEGVDVDSLRALVASGRCEDALERIDDLDREERRLPDVRVLEANCLLNGSRSVEEVYRKDRYQRMLIGRGVAALPAELTKTFYETRVSFEQKARKKAIKLFREAHDDAPEQQDILVGTVAALANAEADAEAAELLLEHEGFLDANAARDLARLVGDRLLLRDEEGARTLAEALVLRLEGFPVSWLARMRVALIDHDVDTALECARRLTPPPEGTREGLKKLARRLVFERRWSDLVPITLELGQTEPGALVLFALARDRAAFGSGAAAWRDLAQRLGPERDPEAPISIALTHYLQIHEDGVEPDASLHLSASRFLAERGALEAAIAEADASIQKAPEKVEAWLHLSKLLRAQFQFDLALEAALEALRHGDGESAREAAAIAARLHYALGEDRLAIELIEARSVDDPLSRALAHLGLGERDAARAWFERAAAGEGREASMARAELEALERAPSGR